MANHDASAGLSRTIRNVAAMLAISRSRGIVDTVDLVA